MQMGERDQKYIKKNFFFYYGYDKRQGKISFNF